MMKFIEQCDLSRYHLFPFYLLDNNKNNLIITSYEKYSIPLSSTKKTDFYEKIQNYFAGNSNPLYVVSIDGKLSEYLKCLQEFNQIIKVGNSKDDLFIIIDNEVIDVPDFKNNFIFHG